MFPDSARSRVVFTSAAEERFYRACREGLGASWDVYYSCMLSAHSKNEGFTDAEIDFVLYHPRYGVILVEVKGGRIAYDAEAKAYASINRHNERFEIKNPFQQVFAWRGRLVRALKAQHFKVPVTHAVAFCDIGKSDLNSFASNEARLIITRDHLQDIEAFVKELVHFEHPPRFLQFEDKRESLRTLLVGQSFSTPLNVRAYIDAHEARLKDQEVLSDAFVMPIIATRELAIEGEAGTGKTLIATLLARHFAALGERVLLLSSNPMLNEMLAADLSKAVLVRTYEDALQMARQTKDLQPFDVLICDEGQDVSPETWTQLGKLRRVRAAHGESKRHETSARFYIFFDRSQGVFAGSKDSHKAYVPEKVLPIRGPYFPLVANYRTTREIADFARSFRSGSPTFAAHSSRLGYVPEIVVYKDATDARAKLETLVKRLTKAERLEARELTVLSARRIEAEPSVLASMESLAGFPLRQIGRVARTAKDDVQAMQHPDTICASTVQSFKGLETKIGILLNFSEYHMPLSNALMANLFYTAATRAKHMLYVFLQENDPKLRAVEGVIQRIKTSGALIAGENLATQQYMGEVAYFSEGRFGMLRVQESTFSKGGVMFFPEDLRRAGILTVKVGDEISFRPRLDGHQLVATELRLNASARRSA